jgi:hypothetical protein
MLVGVRAINSSAAARLLVGYSALASFVYGTDTVLLVSVSEHKLGTGANGFGYLMAGLGVGGVLMAGGVNKLAGSSRLALIITTGMAVYCLPTALLTIVHAPAIAFVLQVIRGGGTLVVDVLAVTALQRAMPSDLLARVFGVFFAFILGAISLGTLIMPSVVSALGLDGALLLMAFAPVAGGLLGYPGLVRLDRASVARMAELAPRIAALEGVGILAMASRPVLERLAQAATEITVPAGEVVVRQGDEADALYVILDGSFAVTSVGEAGGPERFIRTMGPGTLFGEIGLLERIPRTATVTTVEPGRCLRIDGDTFLDVLSTAQPASALVEGARARLANTHPSRRPTYVPAAAS